MTLLMKMMEKRNDFNPPLTALEIASFLFAEPNKDTVEHPRKMWIWETPMSEFMTKKAVNQELKEVNALMLWSWNSPFKEFNMENLLKYKDSLKKRLKFLDNPDKYQDKLMAAKAVPMNYFIEFDRTGKAMCPMHSERMPSLHYYKKNNNAYCFSCRKYFDTVELVRQLHKLEFTPAINMILGK